MRTLATLLLGVCLSMGSAEAKTGPRQPVEKRLEAAKELYFEGRFQEAVFDLENLLGGELKRPQRIEALKYQAFSLFLLKLLSEARAVWMKILDLDARFEADPVEVSPEILAFFADATAEYRRTHPPPTPKTDGSKGTEEVIANPTGTGGAQTSTPPEDPPPPTWENDTRGCGIALCLLPLGIGQFINGRYVKGVVFLGLEAIFLGLNVGLYWLNQSQLVNDVPRDQAAFDKNYIMQQTFFGLFVATAIVGIIDAYVFY